jgi:hypothetical protein
LDLAHRITKFEAGYFPVILACAVNRGVGIAIDGVVEQVEEICAELQVQPFMNREPFHDRQVGGKCPRSIERISLDITQVTLGGISKWARRIRWVRYVRNRFVKREVMKLRVNTS